MNKSVTPKQLELTAGKTREELLIQSLPPNIDPESPAFKADAAKVERAEQQQAARAALGMSDEMSRANLILASVGLPPNPNNEDEFDWDSPTEDSIILREQRATAAYRNRRGELIIRQRASWNDDLDTFVYISPENEVAFMEGLAKKARE